jgi:hypothetical protein
VDLGDLMRRHDGVVARRQVLSADGTDKDIERLLRQRRWAREAPDGQSAR